MRCVVHRCSWSSGGTGGSIILGVIGIASPAVGGGGGGGGASSRSVTSKIVKEVLGTANRLESSGGRDGSSAIFKAGWPSGTRWCNNKRKIPACAITKTLRISFSSPESSIHFFLSFSDWSITSYIQFKIRFQASWAVSNKGVSCPFCFLASRACSLVQLLGNPWRAPLDTSRNRTSGRNVWLGSTRCAVCCVRPRSEV